MPGPKGLKQVRKEDKVWRGSHLSTGAATNEIKSRAISKPENIQRDMRRREVLRLRMEPKPDGSTRRLWEIREIVKNTPGLVPPDMEYATTSVSTDLLTCVQAVSEEVKEIAHEYLPIELEKLDRSENSVWQGIEQANDLFDMIDWSDPQEIHANARTLQRAMDIIDKGTKALDRIMARRAKYLPIEIAKKVEMNHSVVKISLDDYLETRREAEDAAIEGEFEASE